MKQDERKDYASRNMAGVAYGEMIRNSRRKKGMSQEELGALAHVGKNAVGAGKQIPDETVRLFTDRYSQLNEYHRQVILREMDVLIDMQDNKPVSARKLVQIYRNDLSACAGPSWGIGDESGEPVWLYEDSVTSRADEIIRVSGDSMEPRYHDGDQVLVQHTSNIRPGEIGIFVTGDMGYIKEFQKEGLRSLNPEYPLMRFSDMDEVRCIGRVIGTMRKDMYASIADIEHFTTAGMRG